MAATILCAMVLTACAHNEAPQLILPPAELATCADEPPIPEIAAYRWEAIAFIASQQPTPELAAAKAVELAQIDAIDRDRIELDLILAFRSAWGDCRAKVDGLAAWRETAGTD